MPCLLECALSIGLWGRCLLGLRRVVARRSSRWLRICLWLFLWLLLWLWLWGRVAIRLLEGLQWVDIALRLVPSAPHLDGLVTGKLVAVAVEGERLDDLLVGDPRDGI